MSAPSPPGSAPSVRRRRDAGTPPDAGRVAGALSRAAGRLMGRLADLEAQLDAGEGMAWPDYVATLAVLTQVVAQTAPGGRGELLTTAQMADRLGLSPKTLLKHKANRAITPALQRGKLVRWRGTETVR